MVAAASALIPNTLATTSHGMVAVELNHHYRSPGSKLPSHQSSSWNLAGAGDGLCPVGRPGCTAAHHNNSAETSASLVPIPLTLPPNIPNHTPMGPSNGWCPRQ